VLHCEGKFRRRKHFLQIQSMLMRSVQREQEFVAIVDLEMDPRLLTAGDNAYFVRCPTMGQSSSRGTTDSEGEREKQRHQGEEEEANNRRQTTSNDNASSIRQPVAEMQQLLAGHGEGEEADLLELSLANNGHGQQQGGGQWTYPIISNPNRFRYDPSSTIQQPIFGTAWPSRRQPVRMEKSKHFG
jgi:hypothetical protein